VPSRVPNRRLVAGRSRGEKRGAYLLPLEIRWPEEEERPVVIFALSPRGGGV